MSGKTGRSSNRVAIGATVLFAALRDRTGLESILLEWCRDGDLEIQISDYSVQEVEHIVDIGTAHLRDFIAKTHIKVVSRPSIVKNPDYSKYAAEAKKMLELPDRPTYVFAKEYLAENPKGVFLTHEGGFLKAKEHLFGRAMTVKEYMGSLLA